MKKVLWFVLFFALKSNLIFSQCAYTGTPLTQAGSTYTFCIDNSNTITTATVRSGQYVVVNVVKGFNYTFSIGNVFNGGRAENLTILNASTNANVSPAAFSSGTSGTSFTWTASLTGQIKILLSRGSCANDNATGGTMTLTLNSVGNTQDSQTAFGTDQWVGHVYNWTGTAPPGGTSPSTPSATNPFTSANYVGYYNVNSETISEGFGGDYNCFQVYSNGTNATNIYTEQYAVRYRMRSTKVGCYLATFNGDDGIRVYVDGVKVFDEWKEQPPTGYGNVLLYLNGNSDIIFDFYENGGQNTANFSLAPFTSNPNTISQTTINVCSGVSPGALDGNAYTYNGGTANPSITFQWQSSTDNVTFTNISGATSEDYTPPTQTTTTTNIIRYYRRIVTASAGNAGGCTYNSNVVTVTTSPGTPATPGTISGTVTQCPSLTGQIYSIAAVNNANNYTWSVPTGWSITSGNGTTSITVTTGTTGQNGNITVNASNGCGTSANRTLAVTVSTLAVAGTASSNQTICSGTTPANLTLTGNTGTIQWQSSTDNVTFTNISGATSATLTGTTIGALTATRYYRAFITGGCSTATSNVVTITVNPTSVAGTASANQTICSGSTPANITLTGSTGTIQWQSSTNNVTFTNISGANSATLAGTTIGTLTATRYYRAVVTSGVCASATSNVVTITINPTSVAGTASANQTICLGSTPANLTLTGSTGTIQWQSSTDNVTFTNISGANSATLTGTTIGTLTATRYYRAVVTSGVCASATSNVVTITVNPTSVAGTASTSQTICSGTTPANLTLTGSTGTIQWQSSTDNVTFTNISGANSATLAGTTIGTLTATRYYRTVVTSGVCASATSNVVTISIGGNSTWNGSNWDVTPSGTTNLIFNGDYTSSGDINGCICTVNTGNVVINSGHDMSLIGSVSVNGGSLTFENNSNLIQQQNVSNSGNITVKRNSTPLRRLDYTLWSSPVVGQNLLNFSPATLTNRFYTYNTNTNLYDVIGSPASTNFATGKGYLIRVPNNFPSITPTIYNGVFTGVPNNGNISFALVDGGSDTVRFNATGNPYPSSINLDNFITSNSSNIEGTLWFWRKLNDDNNPVSYSTCTTVGCTINNSHNYTDENLISVGQGFLVKAKAGATTVNFTNSIRSSENVNQFFRTASIDRYWLELKNVADKSFGKKLIAYVDDATLGYDDGKDGLYLNDSPIALTSIIDNKELIIQARPTFDTGDIIPLNFKTTIADTYSVTLTEKEGIFTSQPIYLRDNQTSTIHNLQQSAYIFTSDVGNFAGRFDILYDSALSNNDNYFENSILVFSSNSNLIIKSTKDLIDSIAIYDLSGRLLLNEKGFNSLEEHLKIRQTNQVLIVKVKTIDRAVKIQKVLF
ncbi:hypothetical protein GCM10011508_22660 [Flavobacterium lutivivi]|nr:hypothetical protein GCM10011508_22660 [Flavobacterium lutivivi]